MPRRQIAGMRVIVTGASSGIGREISLELAREGAKLIVTARRHDRLQQLVSEVQALGAAAIGVVGDISDADTRQRLLDAAVQSFDGLDAVINNAGVGAVGSFAMANEARLRRVMEVNFFAPVELIRAALPLLRAGTRPILVNIASVLGHRAIPNRSEYCASKFALHGFSDALRCELAGEGIDVLLVSPSTTASEFFDAELDAQSNRRPFARGTMLPRTAARQTVAAMRSGRHEIILTVGGRLLVWFDRLCPPLMNRLLTRFRT